MNYGYMEKDSLKFLKFATSLKAIKRGLSEHMLSLEQTLLNFCEIMGVIFDLKHKINHMVAFKATY